jgi:hypothetical protein
MEGLGSRFAGVPIERPHGLGRFARITDENRPERLVSLPKDHRVDLSMKARLHSIEVDEGDLVELPEQWIPVRLEPNGYATPARKSYTLYYLERA